jgi:phenylacetate-CoA ligase
MSDARATEEGETALGVVGSAFHLVTQGLRQKAVLRRSSAGIEELQQQRLRKLVRHARANSPYYGELYRDINPDSIRLSDLPVVTKAQMMDNFDRFLTVRDVKRKEVEGFMREPERLGEWYQGKYAVSHTSGSSGLQAIIVQDKDMMELLFALQTLRGSPFTRSFTGFLTRLVRRTRLAVVTIGRGFYPSAAVLAYAPTSTRIFINQLWISKIDPVEELVDQLNRFKPEVLLAYANVLEILGREALAGRLRIRDGLRQIINMSEPLSEGAGKLIEEAFGIAVTDNYAMGECMALTTGCLEHHGMHVQADWAILEALDRRNHPVPPGQPGEKALLTNLYNSVQPFIRYEINDVVTFSKDPCPCGSPLPLITKVEGRTDEVVWIDDHGKLRPVHPYVFVDVLDEFPAVGWYQVVQTERNKFLLRAAPAPGRTFDEKELHDIMRRGLEHHDFDGLITVEVKRDESVAPNPNSGKLKRITSKLKEGRPKEEPPGSSRRSRLQ